MIKADTILETARKLNVEAAIEIVKEQHATPLVGDSPAFGSAKGVAKSAGILDVLKRQQVDIVEFKRNTVFRDDVRISKSVHDFDRIINLPKLKAHNQVRFTGATKNLFGFTKGKIKAWQHLRVRNNLDILPIQVKSECKTMVAFRSAKAAELGRNLG